MLAGRRLELLTGIPLIVIDDVILELARVLATKGPMAPKSAADAVHIASAAAYACDYLLTWNCRHIANAEIQRGARRIVERYGFELPVICTPEELMGDEYGSMER